MGLWRKFKKIGSKCARVITDPLTHQARKKVEDNYHRNLAQCEAAHQDALIQANAEYQNQCKQIQDRLQALNSVKHEQEQKYLEERECLRQYLAKKQKAFQETKERIETLFVVLEASIYASALGEVEPIQMALEVFKYSAFFRNQFMALELLHIAAENNQIAILKLLAKVMDIHHKNEAGNTPLEIARASKEICGVLEAISLETEIFWKAVYLEDFQAMQGSLAEGAAINATLPQGYNILEQTIIDKKPYILIRHLIEAGAYSPVPNLSDESLGLPLALELSISHPDWKVRNLLEEFWEIDADITNSEWTPLEGNPNLKIQNCLKAPAKHFYQSEFEQCSTVFTQGGNTRFFGASTLGIIEYDILKAQWSHVFFYNVLCFDDRYPSLPKHLPPLIEPIWQKAFAQEPIQFHYLKNKDNQEQLVLLSRTKTKTRLIKIWLYDAKSNNWQVSAIGPVWKADVMDIASCSGQDTLYLLGRQGQTAELWTYSLSQNRWNTHPCTISSVSNVKGIATPQMSVVQLPSGEERLFIFVARSTELERTVAAHEGSKAQLAIAAAQEVATHAVLVSAQNTVQQMGIHLAAAHEKYLDDNALRLHYWPRSCIYVGEENLDDRCYQSRLIYEQTVATHQQHTVVYHQALSAYQQALTAHQAAKEAVTVACTAEDNARADAAQVSVFGDPFSSISRVKLELWYYEPKNQSWVLTKDSPWPEEAITKRKVQMQALQVSGETHLFFHDRYAEGAGLSSFNPSAPAWDIHVGCPQWSLPQNSDIQEVLSLKVLPGHEHNTEMLLLSRQSPEGLEMQVYHPGAQAWKKINASSEALKLDFNQGVEHYLVPVEQQYRLMSLSARENTIDCVSVPLNILALERKLMATPLPLMPKLSETQLLSLTQLKTKVSHAKHSLLSSAANGDWGSVLEVINTVADINTCTEQGETVLQLALKNKVNLVTLKRLVQAGSSLGRNASEAQGMLDLVKDRKLEDVHNYLASLMERPVLVHDEDIQAQFLQHYYLHLAKAKQFLSDTEVKNCRKIFYYYRLLSNQYPYAVYSLGAFLILGELLNLPAYVLESRVEALRELQTFFAETYAAHKALNAVGVKNLEMLYGLPHRDWNAVRAACVLKEEAHAYALVHQLPDTHPAVLNHVYQKQAVWLYKGTVSTLESFAKILGLESMESLAQWLASKPQEMTQALRAYYPKQSALAADVAKEADEAEILPMPPKQSLEPMLSFIKSSKTEADKKLAHEEQALAAEQEAIEKWLAEREQEFLACLQQINQLIAETHNMDASLRAQYQASLQEIHTYFTQAKAELHHTKEKNIRDIRHKAMKSIAVMVAACALAHVLAPMMASAIGSATTLGANQIITLENILKGALMGGINGAGNKENILKATLKGAGFAALGCIVNSTFGNLINPNMTKHYETLNKAFCNGIEASLRVAIEHGDSKSIISTIGTGLLLDKLPFKPANGLLQELRQNLVTSFIGGAVYAGITGKSFSHSIASAVITGATYTFAAHMGQKLGGILDKKAFPEMHQMKENVREQAAIAAIAKPKPQQEKPLPSPEQSTKRGLLAPAKAEAHGTEIRKAKTKVYKVDSKPKPKAPAKPLRQNRQPQRDYEPEPNEAYEATSQLFFRANVLETLKTTRGGLRHHPLLEPLTQAQESQPLLWQQTMKQSTANTRNQRVSPHAENNNARKPIYSVNSNPILDFFFPPASADECSLPMFETFSDIAITKRKISFKEINLPSDDLLYASEETWNKVQTHERFKLPSVFPESDPNPILDYIGAFGRGIETGRDSITNALKHPIDTLTDICLTSWDGYNALGQVFFGITTASSNIRNIARGQAINYTLDKFSQGDTRIRLEMASHFLTTSILGAAVGGMPRGFISEFRSFTESAIKTNQGFVFNAITNKETTIAKISVQKGAPIYRAATTPEKAIKGKYWALEKPVDSQYALKHGIPPGHYPLNYYVEGTIKPGAVFITRKSVAAGKNPGGKMEIVVRDRDAVLIKEPIAITEPHIRNQELGSRTKFKEMVDIVLQKGPMEPLLGSTQGVNRQFSPKK